MEAYIAAYAIVFSALISGVVSYLLGRGKAEAEPRFLNISGAALLVEAATDLIAKLEERIETLEADRDAQRTELILLRAALAKANERIAELEHENAELRASNDR